MLCERKVSSTKGRCRLSPWFLCLGPQGCILWPPRGQCRTPVLRLRLLVDLVVLGHEAPKDFTQGLSKGAGGPFHPVHREVVEMRMDPVFWEGSP